MRARTLLTRRGAHHGTDLKTKIYATLSLLISLPVFIEGYLRSSGNATLWICWIIVLLMLWSSWPAWRSLRLRQATVVLTGLVILNLFVSPIMAVVNGPPSPTLEPNLRQEIHFIGDAAPGIEGPQRITTNERGHRTNGPIDYEHKPAGVLRIAAIGASTTEESKLDDRKTWTFRLAERLAKRTGRKVEIVNSALSGVRAEQNYYALRESEAYAADIALFILGGNDWDYAISLATASPFYRFMLKFKPFGFGDSVLFKAAKTAERTIREILRRRHGPPAYQVIEDDGSFYLPSKDSLSRPRIKRFHPEAVDPQYAYWVQRIFAECHRRGMVCVFGDQPSAYVASVEPELKKRFWMTPPFADYTIPLEDMVRLAGLYNTWLAKAAHDSGLAFCALAANIPPTTEFLVDDVHLTEKGSNRIADLMEDCLSATGAPAVSAHYTH